jgi:phosphohistidine swiveling domain-containing protein
MKAREHKRTYYGVPIGILMLDSKFERFNGDIGNAQTWPFPVQYKIVRGAVPNKVVDTLNNRHLFQLFADAADELIREGVDGITTTCGFLALYQQELAAHCSVPVATSALLQVPMVARVLPKGKRPGILTFSAESLTMHHLAAVGIDPDTPVVGLPAASELQRSIREGDDTVPFDVLKSEVLDAAERMLKDDPSIGAIVCECTNITPYSHEINRCLGVPVFDMVTLVHWFHRALRPQRFPQD